MIIVVMGVAGSGKTTVGTLLARELGWTFVEGDDFHPPANFEKLSRGVPLDDGDREPWLQAIRRRIAELIEAQQQAVIACSALKGSYREVLRVSDEVRFVYLKAAPAAIRQRLKKRTGHFMHPGLLDDQFETLEEPERALRLDASRPPAEIVRQIRDYFRL